MNLLVLCTDTFRADYLGCYGSSWVETPRLDALAGQGARFTRFFGEGLPTLPARRVLYTGRGIFPFTYRPQKSDQVQLPGWHPLEEEDVTMAEWLRECGYTTALVSDLYHMMKPGKNFHRGFHSWQWIRGQETDPLVPTPSIDRDLSPYVRPEVPANAPVRRMVAQYLNNRAGWKGEEDYFAAQVMRAAADWIRSYGRLRPWMLWVESFDPHEPWDAPPEYVDRYCPGYQGRELIWAPSFTRDCSEAEFARIRGHYAGKCTHVDRWCGHVLDTLEEQGLAGETLVVFLSDHGTMMGEQGEIHKGADRIRIQVSRSPLIIRHPGGEGAGRVVESLLQHQDLMPTLLEMLGVPAPERCDGMSFWDAGEGPRETGRSYAVTGFGWYASVRTRDWNYQAPWAAPSTGTPRAPELYDCRTDPDELTNVIAQHPEVAGEMQARLDEALARGAAPRGSVPETETPAAVPGVRW